MLMGERWIETPTDDRYIAADYLFSVLAIMSAELGALGHMSPQPRDMIAEIFLAVAIQLHNLELGNIDLDELLDDDTLIQVLAALAEGYTQEDIEKLIEQMLDAATRFLQIHYDAFAAPASLWLYEIDPTQFVLDVETAEEVGFMNPGNVTTSIIEDGRIAYVHIASFMNNVALDSETLFPFFEEVQDFEHLIIDLRGNGGGFTNSFLENVV